MRTLLPLRYFDAVARAGSIRKAAETLAITSSALNRRILAMEEDLGAELFERLPNGVRLSAAGEIYLHHARMQLSDIERVKSQIADLGGIRRGHVAVACSQALLTSFLPQQIAQYREEFPAVTFSVNLRDRDQAEAALTNLSADLALVYEPVRMNDFHILLQAHQPLYALMRNDHPLAQKPEIRLIDCLNYPIALPTTAYGVRHLLELALRHNPATLEPAIESDSFEFLRQQTICSDLLSFQIAVGLPQEAAELGLITREIPSRDVPQGSLYLGQLRGRTLSVAAAKFANQLVQSLEQRFECH